MRWVFYLLFFINGASFVFGFFFLKPVSQIELVEPQPTKAGRAAAGVLLLKENRLAATSEEFVENESGAEPVPVAVPSRKRTYSNADESQLPQTKCYKVGPFKTRIDADSFHAKIDLGAGTWKIEDQPESVSVVYWAYIPATSTRNEALDNLRSLQMAGIDSFVVSQGDHLNAISLGTFSSKESAELVSSKVGSLGFGVEVEERRQSASSYWLFLEVETGQDQVKVESKSTTNVQASIFSCEMFAQAEIIP